MYLVMPNRQKQLLAETERGLNFAYAAYGADSIHPLVLKMLSLRAMSLAGVARLREAIVVEKKSLAGLRQATGPESLEVITCLQNLAGYTFGSGALKESIAYSREVIAIMEKKVSQDSTDYGMTLAALSGTLLAARQTADARDLAERAERILANTRGRTDRFALRTRSILAIATAYQGRHADAMRLLDVVAEADPAIRDSVHTTYQRGVVLRLVGDASAAAATQKISLGRVANGDPLTGYHRSLSLPELGLAELALGDADAAETAFKEFIAASNQQSQTMTPTYAESLVGLGRVEMLRNAPQRALAHLTRADAFWRDFGPDNRWAGEAALWLGRCHLALGQKAEAVDALRRAERLLSTSPIPADAELVKLARQH
jgi:tetratricopeptide (TPR) repeat protein